METLNLVVPASVPMINLLGHDDAVLRTLEHGLFPVTFHVRGHKITMNGPSEEISLAGRLMRELIAVVVSGEHLTTDAVERAISITKSGLARPTVLMSTDIVTARGKTIRPKTLGQKAYIEAIDAHAVTFGIGPAGTGKTYLAVAKAVMALMNKDVKRIVLSRPVVEAGESLGYLPGTLNDKIDPYMRPLYDALYDMLDPEAIVKFLAAGTIEIAPLAYMRGRTLTDAFVILDEAQNTTPEQMKMFLTRLGFGSTMVITGDLTQVDLPRKATSGLALARRILAGVDNVAFSDFGSADVVRNRIVADIIDAYTRYEEDES
ncbi:PhoH family protein [Arcanobacterium canis]